MRDLGIKFGEFIQDEDAPSLSDKNRMKKTKLPYRRWCVSVNKLTGRTEVTYAQPKGN